MGIRGWRIVGIAILAGGLLALLASGAQAAIEVGFSVSTQVNPFYKAMADGVRDEAKAQGMEATILNAEDKLEKQIADVEDFIQKKVDVIIINATHDGAAAVLNKAVEAGIPVVTLQRKKDIIITAGGKNITPAFIENKLKFSSYIQDAVVIGDRRKFLTALILIDEDNVTKYAQDKRIPFTTFGDVTKNEEIYKLIHQEVQKMNKTLSKVETIKKFSLLPRRFYEEDGDVTPTKKVKRAFLEKRYADLIEKLYQG